MKYISRSQQIIITTDQILSLLQSPLARNQLRLTIQRANETCATYRLKKMEGPAQDLEAEVIIMLNKMLATMDKGIQNEIVN